MEINVCMSTNDNYSKYAGVLIASILCNAKESDNLHFYVIDDEISQSQKDLIFDLKKIKNCEINFIKFKKEDFTGFECVKTHFYIPLSAYSILKLPTILPEIDKIIYLDCDVVVNDSLSDLFGMELYGNSIGGVLDIAYKKMNKRVQLPPKNKYVNTGMLLIDLKNWRENNIEEQFTEYALKHSKKITCGDQEVVNSVLQGKIKTLPSKWNVQVSNFSNRSDYMKRPGIIHYISHQKPWLYASWNYFTEYYLKYQQLTPWALDEKTFFDWSVKGKIISAFKYLKYRPLFFLHPKFWLAVICTYPRRAVIKLCK